MISEQQKSLYLQAFFKQLDMGLEPTTYALRMRRSTD